MMHKQQMWVTLLEEWCKTRSGLTLPFLVGASAIHASRDSAPTTARQIIEYIKQSQETDRYFRIQECGATGFPVVGIVQSKGETGYKVFLDEKWGDTEDDQMMRYLSASEAAIQSGYVSRVPDYPDFSWGDFTAEELRFIDRVYAQQ